MAAARAAKDRGGAIAPSAGKALRVAPSWLGPSLGLALILAVAVVAASGLTAWHYTAQDTRLVRTWADGLAQRVLTRVDELRATLKEWGDDPRLQRALAQGDRQRLEAVRNELRQALPQALAVSLRTRSQALSPSQRNVELSFAGRDLIRQAVQSGEVTQLEVHRVGQPQRHLALAGPVRERGGDGVIGVVYLALPMSLLPETGSAARGIARIGYQQRIGQSLVMVAGGFDAEEPARTPDYSVPIPGTRLTIAVWRERHGEFPAQLAGALVGLYLLLALALAAVVALSYRRLKRSVAEDLAGVLAVIDDAADARPLRPIAPRLRETARFQEQMLPRLRALSAAARSAEGSQDLALPADDPERQQDAQAQSGGRDANEELAAELEELLARPESAEPRARRRADSAAPAEVFREREMCGGFGRELTDGLAREIGQALGSEIRAGGGRAAFVGHDRGEATQALASVLGEGLRASGCEVIDLGMVPTALLYFACAGQGEGAGGAMITATAESDDELRIEAILDGHTLLPEQIQQLRERILGENFAVGEGGRRQQDPVAAYGERFEEDIALARTLRLVIDCGRGASASIAPALFRRLGCQVLELGCDAPAEADDRPSRDLAQPGQLAELAGRVVSEEADLGLAFDAAGNRLGIIASDGGFIATDQLLMFLAADVLSRQLGTDIVCDVACSRQLLSEVRRHGGRLVLWRPEEASLSVKLRETGALLGGDVRGKVLVAERWIGLEDAFYAAARLVELLSLDPRSSAEVFAALPESRITPEFFLELPQGESERVLAGLIESSPELGATKVSSEGGLRAGYDQGWGLVRQRYRETGLAFRFEADDDAALGRIQGHFRRILTEVSPSVSPPF